MSIINISQNVAILVDGNNVEIGIRDMVKSKNAMLNYDTFIPKLVGVRYLNRLKYFREGKEISTSLAKRLHEKFYGVVIPCYKSADVPLAIEATQLADKVDTMIIMSGDVDYIELVRHLKAKGVRVELACVKKSLANVMKKEADHVHYIEKKDVYFHKNTRNSQGDSSISSTETKS